MNKIDKTKQEWFDHYSDIFRGEIEPRIKKLQDRKAEAQKAIAEIRGNVNKLNNQVEELEIQRKALISKAGLGEEVDGNVKKVSGIDTQIPVLLEVRDRLQGKLDPFKSDIEDIEEKIKRITERSCINTHILEQKKLDADFAIFNRRSDGYKEALQAVLQELAPEINASSIYDWRGDVLQGVPSYD